MQFKTNYLCPLFIFIGLFLGHLYWPLIIPGGLFPLIATAISFFTIVIYNDYRCFDFGSTAIVFLAATALVWVSMYKPLHQSNENTTHKQIPVRHIIKTTNYIITRKFMIKQINGGDSYYDKYYFVVKIGTNKGEKIYELQQGNSARLWIITPIGNALTTKFFHNAEFKGPLSSVGSLIEDRDQRVYWE